MGSDTAAVATLLQRAQCGDADEALRLAEEALRECSGDLADGEAGMHFVRYVALGVLGRSSEILNSLDLMRRSAEREGNQGWRSCALAGRAFRMLQMGDQFADRDANAALQDLVDAEIALDAGVEDSVILERAHNGVGQGYHSLRLYELAMPQYEAAYAVSPKDGINRTMRQLNLANVHLEWALELTGVGQVAEAEEHSHSAGRHAALAFEDACGPDAEWWRQESSMIAACAAAAGPDPAGAALALEAYAARPWERGQASDIVSSLPFLSAALRRSGEHERALEVIERAVVDLPEDAGWITTAAIYHTRAMLLADEGGRAATAALAYGEILARALWSLRQATLETAATMMSYARLRSEHALVARTAEIDSLTEVANRRAFDSVVESMRVSIDERPVAVLLIDVDDFKRVNDTRGHAAGDSVLRLVAGVLAAEVRSGDIVARLGGDEFGVLLPGAGTSAAYLVADRMAKVIGALEGEAVTVSIGVANGATSAVIETLHGADLAMYVAKRAGGNQASLHQPAP